MLEDPSVTVVSSGGDVSSSSNEPPHPPSHAMPADKARTKKWAPKTFNGCLTCKKRRIKCDEGKPACQRCIKSNIRCSGYAPPKIRLFEPASSASASTPGAAPTTTAPSTATSTTAVVPTNPSMPDEQQLQTYLNSYLRPRELALGARFSTEEEYQSFQFFLEKTSDLISVYSQPYLWTVHLPQATWHHPAIKHSIIALSSLHQSLTMIGPAAQRASHNFLFHYNNAIRALVADNPPVDIVLASCVIFWALENFNGSGQAAFDHMKAAVRILGEWKSKRGLNDPTHELIRKYIEPAIRDGVKFASKNRVQELQSQMSALSLTTRDVRIMNIEYPAFNTLEKAGEYLGECINELLTLKNQSFTPSPEIVEAIESLDARLYKWMNLFQNLTATGPVHIRRMLIVHNVAANILLDQLKAQAGWKSEDPHRCRFSFIVLEIEDMLRHDPLATVESCRKRLPWLGLIPPIFLSAIAAPKVETRRRAISALRLLDVMEGPWTTEIAAQVAEQIPRIAQECSISPSEVELRHVNFEFDKRGRVLSMRWEPNAERLRGVRFSKEIEVPAVNWIDCDLPGLISNFGYRFSEV